MTKNNNFEIPKTPQDLEPMMYEYINTHLRRYPKLVCLDVPIQALSFYTYWNDLDWKRGKHPIKSLSMTVATWLLNAQSRVPDYKMKQYMKQHNASFTMKDLTKPENDFVLEDLR